MRKPKFSEVKFLVFDIESQGFDKFLIGGVYDGKNFAHTEKTRNFKNLMELIFKSPDNITIVYAHFGGIFDFIHVLDFLFSESPKILIENIILQGSKILSMEVVYLNRRMKFIDSSGLFPFSLEKLSKSFGVKHVKIDHDVSNLTEVTTELIEYLKNDCVGLYECLDVYFKKNDIYDLPHQMTRSGLSFQAFKQFNGHVLPKYSGEINDYSRKSYFGGRTEIFKPIYDHEEKPLYYYDINSLYPSVMRENDFMGATKKFVSKFDENELGIYKMELECPDIEIPLLGIPYQGKYIFPVGKIQGYFCSPEINKALSLGYKIKKVYSGITFHNQGKIFKDFVDFYYSKRLKTSCPVEKIIYKDILNHLYGRLGINQDREEISFEKLEGSRILSEIKIKDYYIHLYSREKKIYIYSAPALSSFVTSYARLKLYSYFEKAGFNNIYYCDTDSLFTTTKLENSTNLGQMKLEKTLKQACFLLPKTYSLIDINNVQDIKLKGIPHKSIGHIDIDTFFDSVSGEMRLPEFKVQKGLAKIKTGFKNKNLFHIINSSSKSLKAVYDKREIIKLGNEYTTRPKRIR